MLRLTLAAVCAGLLLAASPAVAGTYRGPDPAGDLIDGWTRAPAPDHTNGDVVSLTLAHRWRRVIVRLQAVELSTPTGDQWIDALVYLQTRRGVVGFYTEFDATHPTSAALADFDGRRCHGSAVAFDYGAATVRASIPRRCIGYPRWVRGSVQLSTGNGDFAPGTQWWDYVPDRDVNNPSFQWTPRVYRN